MRKLLRKIKTKLLEIYMFLYGKIHGIKKNKIVFSSFNGKQYSCNPRFISERLHEKMPDAEIVWCMRKGKVQSIPDYVRVVPCQGIAYLKEMATAKVWVSNFELHRPMYKSKKQFYIQTWHGDRGFKKVCYDAFPDGNFKMLEEKIADLCITGSEYGFNKFRRAFRYKGEILKVGMPRNDELVNGSEARKTEIKRAVGIDDETKVLLYAPTFRDAHRSSQNLLIDVQECLRILEEKGERWVCLVRAHSAVLGGLNISESSDKIIDVTAYEDMADLMIITDMIISDYSSCANDFVITEKPAILAVFDEEEYISGSRQFSATPREAGHICASSQEELSDILKNMDSMDWKSINQKINDFYGTHETGKSTEVIVDRIMDVVLGE